jgi:hypothetical protein
LPGAPAAERLLGYRLLLVAFAPTLWLLLAASSYVGVSLTEVVLVLATALA